MTYCCHVAFNYCPRDEGKKILKVSLLERNSLCARWQIYSAFSIYSTSHLQTNANKLLPHPRIQPSFDTYFYTPNNQRRTSTTTRRTQSSSMSQTTFEMQIHPIVKSSWTLPSWWCMTKFIFFLNEPLTFLSFSLLRSDVNFRNVLSVGDIMCHITELSIYLNEIIFGLIDNTINYLAKLWQKHFLIAYHQLVFPLYIFMSRIWLTNHLRSHNSMIVCKPNTKSNNSKRVASS